MIVPASLEERAEVKVSVEISVEMKVTLDSDENIIKFKVNIKNKALSHRVRVLFNTEIASKLSIADQQFGIIERPASLENDLALWEERIYYIDQEELQVKNL